MSAYAPLVEMTRGARGGEGLVEELHIGAVAVVDGTGALVAEVGSAEVPVHLRSTAKPFQLLPLLLDGLHERPLSRPDAAGRAPKRPVQLSQEDLAVMMASHSGQVAHTGRVARLLKAVGLGAEDLRCGAHAPVHGATAETLLLGAQVPSALHNNCSGKHTNMLLTCLHNGYPLPTYLDRDHPLQERIRRIVAAFSGQDEASLGECVDGCSAPTFVMPLWGLARMFAHLAWPEGAPPVEGREVGEALRTLWAASTGHPFLIAGAGRLDTALMESCEGRVMAKIGAAGAYVFGVRPDARWPTGLGVAVKVLDGDASGAVRPLVVTELLRQLGVVEGALPAALEAVVVRQVSNHLGLTVGHQTAVFGLNSEQP